MSLENSLDNKKDVVVLHIHEEHAKGAIMLGEEIKRIQTNKITIQDNNPEWDFMTLQNLHLWVDKDIRDVVVSYDGKEWYKIDLSNKDISVIKCCS